MPDAYEVALTPGALADLDRLDTFLRDKNPAAAVRMEMALIIARMRLAEKKSKEPPTLQPAFGPALFAS